MEVGRPCWTRREVEFEGITRRNQHVLVVIELGSACMCDTGDFRRRLLVLLVKTRPVRRLSSSSSIMRSLRPDASMGIEAIGSLLDDDCAPPAPVAS